MQDRTFVTGRWLIALLAMSLALTLSAPRRVRAQTPTCIERVTSYATFTTCTGTLADGQPYLFLVPTNWDGTLAMFCQGYVGSGTSYDLGAVLNNGITRWLLSHGHAVATSFGGHGWAVHEAMRNQLETLDIFTSLYGPPSRAIPYGGSLGGIIAAGLVQQHPERFAGALPMAGPLAGSIATWNQGLDFAFVVQQLLGPESGLEVVHITDPGSPTSGNWGLGRQLLDQVQGTPEGRARIALACAMNEVSPWIDPFAAAPAADDYETQEFNQYIWAREVLTFYLFGVGRGDIEARAGGNPSWNTDVNYEAQLDRSIYRDEVVALYAMAGLSLEEDLARLNAAPRIEADPAAVEYLKENIVFNGDFGGVPVLALHTIGDGLVVVQQEFAYRSAALQAQDSQLLRQAFLYRGGHATITWAETIAGFQALFHRIDAGRWEGSASPEGLNAAALALGPSYYLWPPSFVEYDPAPYLRPYDLADPRALAARGPSEVQSATSSANGNSLFAARSLTAWPLPYRGGSLHVSFRAGASAGASTDVAIYDVSGRRVRLLTGAGRGGSQSLQWDGRDANGMEVGSGVYFLHATGVGRGTPVKIAVVR